MTDDGRTLLTLILIFVPLSLVSVGGGPAVFAEIQQQAVVIQGWTSEREFAGLFGISRAAPGPGVLLVTLLGWKAAGWAGALVASLAFFVPSSLVIFGVARIWNRYRGTGWHTATEAGFAPIAVGLVFAGALAILRSGGNGAGLAWAVAFGVAACRILKPSVHPLLLLAVGALVFALSAVRL